MVVWPAPIAALARVLGVEVTGSRAHRAVAGPDPFETLALQVRLERLACQVRVLEADPHIWARARRLQAVEAAYDAVLLEAWRLVVAGVPAAEARLVPVRAGEHVPDRLTAELELSARGWTW